MLDVSTAQKELTVTIEVETNLQSLQAPHHQASWICMHALVNYVQNLFMQIALMVHGKALLTAACMCVTE